MQHRLKAPSGPAGARIFAAEALEQVLVAVNHLVAALDVRLGRVALLTLAAWLESRPGRGSDCGVAWATSCGFAGLYRQVSRRSVPLERANGKSRADWRPRFGAFPFVSR